MSADFKLFALDYGQLRYHRNYDEPYMYIPLPFKSFENSVSFSDIHELKDKADWDNHIFIY